MSISPTQEEKEYIAGFLDGDGSMGILNQTKHLRRPSVFVNFRQSKSSGIPEILSFVQERYGGSIKSQKPSNPNKHRKSWRLHLGPRAGKLLDILEDHDRNGIVKKLQAEKLLEYIMMTDESKEDYAMDYTEELKLLKQTTLLTVVVDPDRVTDAYIAGLFEAEGCVGIYNGARSIQLQTSITQKSCRRLLEAVKEKLGFGCVIRGRGGCIQFTGRQSAKLFKRIHPYLRGQKRAQVELGMKFQCQLESTRRHGKDRSRTPDEIREFQKLARQMKEMKKD